MSLGHEDSFWPRESMSCVDGWPARQGAGNRVSPTKAVTTVVAGVPRARAARAAVQRSKGRAVAPKKVSAATRRQSRV